GFSFIHKSFGEYLAGRAVFRTALYLVDRLSGDDEPVDAAGKWAELFALAPLTHPILRFLTDEARRIEISDGMRGAVDALTDVFNHTLRNGFPMDVMSTPDVRYRDLEDRQSNAESTLVSTLSVLAQAIPLPKGQKGVTNAQRVVPNWDTQHSVANLFGRIQPHGQWGAPLACARFDFSNTEMSGVNVHEIKFDGCTFENSDLGNAFFSGCSFVDGNFRNTNVSSSYLVACDYSNVDFEGASVAFADLRDEELADINLSGALTISTLLEGADLRTAQGITEAQLSDSSGNQRTQLPDYIDTSKIPWIEKG
ncbi:MAG: pentapeptide repeat-containing protein, partial [Paracoccaceae bacterium]